MNTSQLIIPQKIKAGFNIRKDTYSGKLAYVIYHDGKVWRKEKSWEDWREKDVVRKYNDELGKYELVANEHSNDITPLEMDNVPLSGFVLNKKVGNTSSGWNHRNTYCRVFDPRGFEVEITIQNLLFILQETNSIKGKGLDGEFVYSWDGKDLVLLPCESIDYVNSKQYSLLQKMKFSAKDLKIGGTYKTKKEEDVVYLGRFDCYNHSISYPENYSTQYDEKVSKKHIFYIDGWQGARADGMFVARSDVAFIAECVSEDCVSNYAELLTQYEDSFHANKITGLTFKTLNPDDLVVKHGVLFFKNSYNNHFYSLIPSNTIGEMCVHSLSQITFNGSQFSIPYTPWTYTIKAEYKQEDCAFLIKRISTKSTLNIGTKYHSIEELIEKLNLVRSYFITESGKLIPREYI